MSGTRTLLANSPKAYVKTAKWPSPDEYRADWTCLERAICASVGFQVPGPPRKAFAEAHEQVNDIIAEVKAGTEPQAKKAAAKDRKTATGDFGRHEGA
jgi:hypothetical protein